MPLKLILLLSITACAGGVQDCHLLPVVECDLACKASKTAGMADGVGVEYKCFSNVLQ